MSDPASAAAEAEAEGLTFEETETLESLLQARVQEAEKRNGRKFTEQEVAQVRQEMTRILTAPEETEKMVKLVQDMKGEAGESFRRMNFIIGLPGGLALMKAMINGADLTAARKEHFVRKIQVPDGLKKDSRGALKISFPRHRRQFALHCGECPPDHDFAAEFDKVKKLASKEELERVQNQCSMLFEFTRQAYKRFLTVNRHFLEKEIIPKYKNAKIEEKLDPENSTIYFFNGEPLAPRVGLFFTEEPYDDQAGE